MNRNLWCDENIPNQAGRIVIITGASSGIGFYAAQFLAEKNATVILAVRNLEKGSNAGKSILAQNPYAKLHILKLDLSDLQSIHAFADEFKNKFSQLNVLINNAGVMACPFTRTKDGLEIQIGTNHFGHFALTALLFPLLKSTFDSRVVSVSSALHKYGKIDFDDINWGKRKYKTWNAYADSKIANLYFAFHLNKNLVERKITVKSVAAHPGVAITELQRHKSSIKILTKLFGQRAEMGALPLIYAAAGSNVSGGDFFGPDGFNEIRGFPKKVNATSRAKEEAISQKLWRVSQSLTNVNFEF